MKGFPDSLLGLAGLAPLAGKLDTLTISALGVLAFLVTACWETRATPKIEAEVQQEKAQPDRKWFFFALQDKQVILAL